jgi:hypothetical protein
VFPYEEVKRLTAVLGTTLGTHAAWLNAQAARAMVASQTAVVPAREPPKRQTTLIAGNISGLHAKQHAQPAPATETGTGHSMALCG